MNTRPPGRHANRLSFPLLAALAYLSGPLAFLLTRAGRRKVVRAGIAVATTAVWVALLLGREHLPAWLEQGQALLPAAIGICVVVGLLGFYMWSEGIRLAAEVGRRDLGRLPDWVRRPQVVGVAGAALPGLGLLLLGRSRRSAAAFWILGPMLVSALLLSRAGWLWNVNRAAGDDGMPGPLMEQFLLIPVLVLAVGALFWICQALEGIRLAVQLRPQRRVRPTADLVALSLVVVLVTFGVVFNAGSTASDLDRIAVRLGDDDLRLIPLGLELAAMKLDPSQPVYVMRAGEMAERLGRRRFATELRSDLAERWRPYVGMLRSRLLAETRMPQLVLPPALPVQVPERTELVEETAEESSPENF